MQISEEDLADLVARVDAERNGWINGDPPEGSGRFEQDDDMTIVGPFGGRGVKGRGQFSARQPELVKLFKGGTGSFELIKTITDGALAVVVGIERSMVRIGDAADPRPWVLRSTQVFRRESDGTWVRLHRHADPLISLRTMDETLALLPDEDESDRADSNT